MSLESGLSENITLSHVHSWIYICNLWAGFISCRSIFSVPTYLKVCGLIAFKQWWVCGGLLKCHHSAGGSCVQEVRETKIICVCKRKASQVTDSSKLYAAHPVGWSFWQQKKKLDWFTGFCWMGDQKSKALVPWCLWSLARRYCHKYTEYILYENTWAILPRFCHFFKLKIQMCLFLVSGSISVGVASPSLIWCPAPDLCQPHQPRPATSQLVLFLLLNLLTWVLSSVCAGLCVPAWIPACLLLLESTA